MCAGVSARSRPQDLEDAATAAPHHGLPPPIRHRKPTSQELNETLSRVGSVVLRGALMAGSFTSPSQEEARYPATMSTGPTGKMALTPRSRMCPCTLSFLPSLVSSKISTPLGSITWAEASPSEDPCISEAARPASREKCGEK